MAQTTPDVRRLGPFSSLVPSFFLPVAYFAIYNLYMHLNISYLMRIKEKHTPTAQSYHHSLWFQTQLVEIRDLGSLVSQTLSRPRNNLVIN